jgi:uncharacterized protein YkwD
VLVPARYGPGDTWPGQSSQQGWARPGSQDCRASAWCGVDRTRPIRTTKRKRRSHFWLAAGLALALPSALLWGTAAAYSAARAVFEAPDNPFGEALTTMLASAGLQDPQPIPAVAQLPQGDSAASNPIPGNDIAGLGATETSQLNETPSPSPTLTLTESPTPTQTPTATTMPSETPSPTATETATPSPTITLTATWTSTATRTTTPTPTRTRTSLPTPTPSKTSTTSHTPTASQIPTEGPSPTASITGTPPPTAAIGDCQTFVNTDYENQVVDLLNHERHLQGLHALTVRNALRAAARVQAADMACNHFTGHTGSDGSSVRDRVETQGYHWTWIGENYMVTSGGPQAAVDWWMNSTPHRNNILSPNYTEFGVGYITSPQADHGGYFVVVFARP